jgi:hypothetical protein
MEDYSATAKVTADVLRDIFWSEITLQKIHRRTFVLIQKFARFAQ